MKVKAPPKVIDFDKIEVKSDRTQVKLGLMAMLIQNLRGQGFFGEM